MLFPKNDAVSFGDLSEQQIHFINTDYNIEEQRESTAYTAPKQNNTVPFLHEFILMKFIL
jgi:hypothetical protein